MRAFRASECTGGLDALNPSHQAHTTKFTVHQKLGRFP